PPISPLFPYTTLFRSLTVAASAARAPAAPPAPADGGVAGSYRATAAGVRANVGGAAATSGARQARLTAYSCADPPPGDTASATADRKSTRLNSSHDQI